MGETVLMHVEELIPEKQMEKEQGCKRLRSVFLSTNEKLEQKLLLRCLIKNG